MLRGGSERHAFLAGQLPEISDAGGHLVLGRAVGRRGQRAHDEDLVVVDLDIGRTGEPGTRKVLGKPGPDLFRDVRVCHSYYIITSLQRSCPAPLKARPPPGRRRYQYGIVR